MYSTLSVKDVLFGNPVFSLEQSDETVLLGKTNEKISATAIRSFESRVANGKAIKEGTVIQFEPYQINTAIIQVNCAEHEEEALVFEVMKGNKKCDLSLSQASIKEGICSLNVVTAQDHRSNDAGKAARNLQDNAIEKLSNAKKGDRFELLQELLYPELFPEKNTDQSSSSKSSSSWSLSSFFSKMVSLWKSLWTFLF